MAVRSQLNAIRQTACKVLDELGSATKIALPNQPGANKLAISIHRNPSPNVASNLTFGAFCHQIFSLQPTNDQISSH